MSFAPRVRSFTKKQLLLCFAVASLFIVAFSLFKSNPAPTDDFAKFPWKKEMLAFRKVCDGWRDDHAVNATLKLYDLQFEPQDEIPQKWSDEPEAITAFKNYCAPYTFTKFIPRADTMYVGLENKVQRCTGPPKKGVYCDWYPICMLDPKKDAISEYVGKAGVWEEKHLVNARKELERNGGPGRVFMMDAGANEGIYTLWAAVLGYKVVSFEANTNLMPLLKKSFSLAGVAKRITMFNNAISHTTGDVVIKEEPGNVGASHISTATELTKNMNSIKKITLDDAFETIKQKIPYLGVGYMKIDIESHEAKLFTGGYNFMSHYYPKSFQIEINTIIPNNNIWVGCDCELFDSILTKLNYTRKDVFWVENTTFCQRSKSFGDSFWKRP